MLCSSGTERNNIMNNYKPNPIYTGNIELPQGLKELTEKIAENVHANWAAGRISEGWIYGESRDDEKKTTPCLVPYADLSDSEKEYDRNTAMSTLRLIIALGYDIKENEKIKMNDKVFRIERKNEDIYKPNPIDTSKIKLPDDLLELTEKIAENVHDIWAIGRMKDGWTYGKQRDDEKKHNPCLVPYDELPDSEKEYDRKTAIETLKLIVALGYTISKNTEETNVSK